MGLAKALQPDFCTDHSCAQELKPVLKCIQNYCKKSLFIDLCLRQLTTTVEWQPFRGTGSSQKAVQPNSLQTYLEFHGGKSVEDFAHVLSDDGPRDLIVTLGCGFYSTACHVIKCNHIGKHSHCFIERAEPDETEKDLSGVFGTVNRTSLCFCPHNNSELSPERKSASLLYSRYFWYMLSKERDCP